MTRDLGACIHLLREQADMSQQQLAERADVPRLVVIGLERGGLHPRFDHLEAVSRALGLELWELIRFAARLSEVIENRHLDTPLMRSENWRAA